MSRAMIITSGLGKRYRLGATRERYLTLRETLVSPLRRARDGATPSRREIWALRDVDLAVSVGEAVGIVGRNGAGKTTLLKLVARITEPTAGTARIGGRVGTLLDVGTGFHYELTGRENIFLNGAVLGMSRTEMRRLFDDVVQFAGVDQFLDTPLKRFSTGMYLRLAFAVAAHLPAEILLVDEVLATGDLEFQRRCLGRISELGSEGRTVLFVSHDLGAVSRLCTRAVWLDGGRVKADGPVDTVLGQYVEASTPAAQRTEVEPVPGARVRLVSVALVDDSGAQLEAVRRDKRFAVQLELEASVPVPDLDIGVYLRNRQGACVIYELYSDSTGHAAGIDPGRRVVSLHVPALLAPGQYVVGVWLGILPAAAYWETFFEDDVLRFEIQPRPDDTQEVLDRERIIQPPVRWRVGRDLIES